jgi:hypothetical protein
MLAEFGLRTPDPLARGIADVLFNCQTEDGRIRPGPKLSVQFCHTASAARLLCRLGFARDKRLDATFEHLLSSQAPDGGWRCNVLKFGSSPDTDASNPGVTLAALDAFRFRKSLVDAPGISKAVDTLLDHWHVKRPLGPCRFGIGSRFIRVEYPFLRYNLFTYVYVLSHYRHAVESSPFRDALARLQATMVDDQIVVEHQNPRLSDLIFCREGLPSALATTRYRQLIRNIAAHDG